MIQAGRLRHSLSLYRNDPARNSMGESVDSFTPYSTIFGEFSPLLGREYFASSQTQSPAEAKVTIRYNADLSDTDRLEYDGTMYDILAVQDVGGRKREMVLYVKESAP